MQKPSFHFLLLVWMCCLHCHDVGAESRKVVTIAVPDNKTATFFEVNFGDDDGGESDSDYILQGHVFQSGFELQLTGTLRWGKRDRGQLHATGEFLCAAGPLDARWVKNAISGVELLYYGAISSTHHHNCATHSINNHNRATNSIHHNNRPSNNDGPCAPSTVVPPTESITAAAPSTLRPGTSAPPTVEPIAILPRAAITVKECTISNSTLLLQYMSMELKDRVGFEVSQTSISRGMLNFSNNELTVVSDQYPAVLLEDVKMLEESELHFSLNNITSTHSALTVNNTSVDNSTITLSDNAVAVRVGHNNASTGAFHFFQVCCEAQLYNPRNGERNQLDKG